MHFAQAVQELGESRAQPDFVGQATTGTDMAIERAAPLVAHDEIHSVVGAEKIDDAHDVRVLQARERAPFLEKALHAVAKPRQIARGHLRRGVAVGAHGERRRQVLLDRHRRFVLVVRKIDEGKAARGECAHDAIVLEAASRGQRLIGLGRHLLL